MPPLSSNKWISMFLDLVHADLKKIDWDAQTSDNLSRDERRALTELVFFFYKDRYSGVLAL